MAGSNRKVHSGNKGFCVDLAIMDSERADNVLVGVECDLTCFASTDDPVEWDATHRAVHESNGWTLHRL